jgi:hypothetical protein
MTVALKPGAYANVVGWIDLGTGKGEILYVNPATRAIETSAPGHPDVELVVEDEANAEVMRLHPVVRLSSCDGPTQATTGLIQQDVPVKAGMKRVRLLYKGGEVHSFTAGSRTVPAGAVLMGLAPVGPAHPHRRDLRATQDVAPEPGVTYTIQAKPEGAGAWQTIAVGRQTPAAALDKNQFPGARRVEVRVLRSTGFADSVVTQQTIDVDE